MTSWYAIKDGDPRGLHLYLRHYSAKKARLRNGHMKRNGGSQRLFVGPGEKAVYATTDGRAVFAWRWSKYRLDGQRGIECTIFRNEGELESSALVREASALAWLRWPGQRLWTYCKATLNRKGELIRWGKCFQLAGWQLCERVGMRFCWEVWPGKEWSVAKEAVRA